MASNKVFVAIGSCSILVFGELMSGTLPKSPSEGDLTAKLAEESPPTLSRNKSLGRINTILPLSANKFYIPPDSKKAAFANSSFRLVWKSATHGDLSNLNKVLDLPQVTNRSPSPIAPKVGPSDHVFSEHFDPLAVHKREYSELSEEEDSDSKSSPNTFYRTAERKRTDTDIQEIDMPSVKELKSLFEKSKEDEVKVVSRFTRSSKKPKITIEPKISSTTVSKTRTETHETEETSKNVSLFIVDEKKSSDSVDNSKEKTSSEYNKFKLQKTYSTDKPKGNTNTTVVNIEADHILKVKDLLSIFKSIGTHKTTLSAVSDVSIETPATDERIKVEKDEEKEAKRENVERTDRSPTTATPELEEKDLKNKYNFEKAIDTSTKSVFDLKRKWEARMVQKEKSEKDAEHSENILKEEKYESHSQVVVENKETNEKSKVSDNVKQTKIVIEGNTTADKSKEVEDKIKESKTEVKTKIVTQVTSDAEKDKKSLENRIIKNEKEYTNIKELKKSNIDSISTPEKSQNIIIEERKDTFRTSVRDLASIFEFKRQTSSPKETKSAPVTPVAKLKFDYNISSTKSDKSVEFFSSRSLRQQNMNIQNDYSESRIHDTSNEVLSTSSTTSKSWSKNKKSSSNIENLKLQFSSQGHPSSNVTKTLNSSNANDSFTTTFSTTITGSVSTSDSVTLEKTNIFKSESHVSNKSSSEKNVKATTVLNHKEIPKASVQATTVLNQKEITKVSAQPNTVTSDKTDSKVKIVGEKEKAVESQPINTQETEVADKTPNQLKAPYFTEMSLGSLERKGSVTKFKSIYEQQSFDSVTEIQQNELLPKQLQHSHSLGSFNLQSNSKETKPKSLSTIVHESNGISDEVDLKNKLNNKVVDLNSKDSSRISKPDKKKGRKSKIEELVESFVKSEGLSNQIEVPPDENLSPISNKESQSPAIIKPMKTTNTFNYQEKEEDKINTHVSEHFVKISKNTTSFSSSSSSSKDKKSREVNEKNLVLRSGSRELRPDELKYFANMASFNKNNHQPVRERRNSIDTSSPTSTLDKNEFSRSKMRSSSRQFRDLHSDELKFFGSKNHLTSQEVTLRQEVLERTLLASTLGENEREE